MTIPILGTPSAYKLTKDYFLGQCPGRGWPTNITQKVPKDLPTGRRFFTLEFLNTAEPERFVSSQLLQLKYYDPNGQRAERVAFDAWDLWAVMPVQGLVQDVEKAGGPISQDDPDYPDLQRYVITAWVSVMKTNYA